MCLGADTRSAWEAGRTPYHITCKEDVIQDTSPDLVSPAGASLSFLPICVSFTADSQAPPSQMG